jgi:hypothetical protein
MGVMKLSLWRKKACYETLDTTFYLDGIFGTADDTVWKVGW